MTAHDDKPGIGRVTRLPASNDDRPVSGSLPDQPLARTLSDFSSFSVLNRLRELAIKAYRRVIREETGLLGDLNDHARAMSELKNIDEYIDIDNRDRKSALKQAEAELRRSEAELEDAEADLLQARKRRLRALAELEAEEKGRASKNSSNRKKKSG
jgi:hypothetical protein